MPTLRGGLLFVNKTPFSSSLSNNRDDSDGLKEIHKHVQKSRDFEKEKENRRKLRKARLLPLWTPISVAPERTPAELVVLTSTEIPPSTNITPSTASATITNHEEVNNDCSSKEGHTDESHLLVASDNITENEKATHDKWN